MHHWIFEPDDQCRNGAAVAQAAQGSNHLATRINIRAAIKQPEQSRSSPAHLPPRQRFGGAQPQLEVRCRAREDLLDLPLRWSEAEAKCGDADPVIDYGVIEPQPHQRGKCTQPWWQPQEQPRSFSALGKTAWPGQDGHQGIRRFGISGAGSIKLSPKSTPKHINAREIALVPERCMPSTIKIVFA